MKDTNKKGPSVLDRVDPPATAPEDLGKQTFHLFAPNMQSYEPMLNVEVYQSGKEYVLWGEGNKYPSYLWDTYNACGVLQGLINGCADFTTGKGIINNTGIDGENEFGDTIADVADKMNLDRWVFGGCAAQIKFNKLGIPIEMAHIDMRKVRVSEDCKFVFIHDQWHKSWGTNRYNKFNAFNLETAAEDGVQIFYYKGIKTRGIYPLPDYGASLVSAEILIKSELFNYDELDNNFMGSGIINFNNGKPTQADRIAVEKGINDKFCGVRSNGSRNTARPLVSFNQDKEHATTYERMQTDDLPDRYQNVYERAYAAMFVPMRAHPILFGMIVPTGFADMQFDEAFDLLNETHIIKKQMELQRVFARIFGRPDAIVCKPFKERNVNDDDGGGGK